jgi:hypothetical protein
MIATLQNNNTHLIIMPDKTLELFPNVVSISCNCQHNINKQTLVLTSKELKLFLHAEYTENSVQQPKMEYQKLNVYASMFRWPDSH